VNIGLHDFVKCHILKSTTNLIFIIVVSSNSLDYVPYTNINLEVVVSNIQLVTFIKQNQHSYTIHIRFRALVVGVAS
jgi:hypothetical protein